LSTVIHNLAEALIRYRRSDLSRNYVSPIHFLMSANCCHVSFSLPPSPTRPRPSKPSKQALLFLFLKPPSSSCSCLCPSPSLRSSCAQGRLCFTHSRILQASCRAAPRRAMADTITPWRCPKLRLPQLSGSFLGTK
jgi:hypothetical protein